MAKSDSDQLSLHTVVSVAAGAAETDGLLEGDDALSEASLSVQTNPLDRVYQHYIEENNGNPIPFGKTQGIKLVTELIGASAGIYAWPPAWAYGKDKTPFVKYSIVVTNPISNVLFLIKATDDMLTDILFELYAPEELKNILNRQSKKMLAYKYTKLSLGSIACALPFAAATYLFPLPGCNTTACIAAISTHSLIANTILHAISWSFILSGEMWYYRILFLPFEKIYSILKQAIQSRRTKLRISHENHKRSIHDKYKRMLIGAFEECINNCVERHMRGERDTVVLDGNTHNGSFIEFVRQYRFAHALVDGNADDDHSCIRDFFTSIHKFMLTYGASILGGTFIVIGALGWEANPFYILGQEGLNLWQSILAGILPSYSTGVLCAFYGSGIGRQIYQFLTSWEGGITPKLSIEARLFPLSFTIMLVLNLYISFFAYGVAQQLIRTVFANEMWDEYRPWISYIATPAMQILSFIPLLLLSNSVIRSASSILGSASDATSITRLLDKSGAMSRRIQQLGGAEVMLQLSRYSNEELEELGIPQDEFLRDLNELNSFSVGNAGSGRISRQRAPSGRYATFGSWPGRNDNEGLSQQLITNEGDPRGGNPSNSIAC